MKIYFTVMLLLGIFMLSCKKQNSIATSETPAMDMIDTSDDSGNLLKYSGNFSNGPYGSIAGNVKIYENAGRYSLVLDSFVVNNGPDLHVYLSKEKQPVNFIDLGKLRSLRGTQVYTIPGVPDFTEFKFTLIHCQQFDHLFGNASLN